MEETIQFIIEKCSDTRIGNVMAASVEKIRQIMYENGINLDEGFETMTEMKRKGIAYEPKEGYIALI